MDLNLLSLFVVVADASSFAGAATKLGLRRSSVSRAIAALERSLNVQLFNRTTRRVSLTTAGTALYARVAPRLASLEEAVGTLPEREEQPSGTVRLTAPSDLGGMVLPGVVTGFSLRYPAVQLDVRLTNQMVDLVAEGFDLALRAATGRLQDSSLVARRLSGLEMQVFASPAYLARMGTPKTSEEAASHLWVSFRGRNPPLPVAPKTPPCIVGDDIFFVYQCVKAGAGLGALPSFLARDDVAAGRLVHVLPRSTVRTGALYLVHPPAQHLPRKVSAFRDYLIEYLGAHPLVAA